MENKKIARGDNDKRTRREDWADVKDDIMYLALKAKYTQHDDLKKLLLSTDDKELVENTSVDSYWADGGDGSGKNMLGKLLMKVRGEIRDSLTSEEKEKAEDEEKKTNN
jgi:hypothetical protein